MKKSKKNLRRNLNLNQNQRSNNSDAITEKRPGLTVRPGLLLILSYSDSVVVLIVGSTIAFPESKLVIIEIILRI